MREPARCSVQCTRGEMSGSSERSAAAEFGLPDWRGIDGYSGYMTWDLHRWRWEFVRRNPRVREAFHASAEESHQELLSWDEYETIAPGEGRAPQEPGFWALPPEPNFFGMQGIPNPSISEQPFLDTLFGPSLFSSAKPPKILRGSVSDLSDFAQGPQQVYCLSHQVIAIVDLTVPLDEQWKKIKEQLSPMMLTRSRRLVSEAKRLQHLRVLDAREDKASWKQIADAVLNNRTDNAPQSARTAWNEAVALRDNWPVLLPNGPGRHDEAQ